MAIERIKNGGFPTDLDFWDDKDTGLFASSGWVNGFMFLLVNKFPGSKAAREQVISVQSGVLCTFSFGHVLTQGGQNLNLLIGSTSGASDVLSRSYAGVFEQFIIEQENFTPNFDTIYLRYSVTGGFFIDAWLIDDVTMTQPVNNPEEFPKTVHFV